LQTIQLKMDSLEIFVENEISRALAKIHGNQPPGAWYDTRLPYCQAIDCAWAGLNAWCIEHDFGDNLSLALPKVEIDRMLFSGAQFPNDQPEKISVQSTQIVEVSMGCNRMMLTLKD
jgi:hypothetical protein